MFLPLTNCVQDTNSPSSETEQPGGSLVEVFLVEAALAAQANQSSYALNQNINPMPYGISTPPTFAPMVIS